VPSNGADAAVWGRAVADTIVSRLFQQELVDFRQVGASPNLTALTAYASAQELFQRGDWPAAERKFADAEALDPQLFQASWGKLLARQWQRKPFEADMARLAERFPPPLDELARIQLEPDIQRRIARYDSLALQYPNYPTLREMQANELFSRGPLVGRLYEGIDSFVLAQNFPASRSDDVHPDSGTWHGDRGLAASNTRGARRRHCPVTRGRTCSGWRSRDDSSAGWPHRHAISCSGRRIHPRLRRCTRLCAWASK
jgi:hypothetical protein